MWVYDPTRWQEENVSYQIAAHLFMGLGGLGILAVKEES